MSFLQAALRRHETKMKLTLGLSPATSLYAAGAFQAAHTP